MSSTSSSPTEMRTRSGRDPGCDLLLVRQLLVGRAGRVDDQRLGIADVGQVRDQPQLLDEPRAGLPAALDAKGEDRAGATRQVPRRQIAIGAVGQRRVVHPADGRVRGQERGHRLRVARVPLHPHRQRLQPLQEEERVEGAQRRTDVAQVLDARLHQVAVLAEGLVEANAVVSRRRLGHAREVPVVPGKAAGLDDDRRRSPCRARR